MIGSNRPAHKSSTAFLMAVVLSSTALTSVALTTGASANDLPSGATVTAGSVDIKSQADGLLINQATQNAIINWHDFSVGRDRSVHFNNGSGATLNRVTGPHISRIDGSLSATGSLYLVNQHGIVIGRDGVVKTGGSFVASTLDISDEDFLDGGNLTFKGDANTKIINQGKVGSLGGDVAFISRHIVNEGSISAPNGSVGLAVGREVLLQDAELDDGKFLVKVGDADSSITEAGVIDAASVELRAHGGNIYALAGNKGGAINASGTSRSGGRIFLTAGGGKVSVKKTLRAKSRRVKTASKSRSSIYINADVVNLAGLLDVSNEDGMGGKIDVGGNVISLTGATLNANGSQGGGDIRVGGAYQGGDFGNLTTATMLSVDDQTLLTASATDAGDGGDIVLWSDELTSFAGRIEAKGKKDGKGGDAEVSGKAKLAYLGFADLTSESGVFGTLLLDPYNVTLSNEPDFNSSGLAATGDDSNINITTLQNQLASANVTITTNGAGTQSGDILVADDITWGANTILTLNADRNIGFFANVTATGTSAGLALNHGAGGDYIIADGASIDLTGSNSSFSLNGQSYTLIRSMAELDNIDTTGLGGHYALATDLNAAGTTYTQALVGHDFANPFTGVFTGLGNTISNLSINSTANLTGLFGRVGGFNPNAEVRNISLEGGTVRGTDNVGGLISRLDGGIVSNAHSSATVSGSNIVIGGLIGYVGGNAVVRNSSASGDVSGDRLIGGLIGQHNGNYGVQTSHASGNVTASGNGAGGLIGSMAGPGGLRNVYASGDVSGANFVGGLVGGSFGNTVSNAYATGNVTGTNFVGGLTGQVYSVFRAANYNNVYASGQVTGTLHTGGLIGEVRSTDASITNNVSNAYFDRDTTGQTVAIGTIVGPLTNSAKDLSTSQARDHLSYANGPFSFNFTNDWYQNADMRPILRAESGPTINGVTAVSNLNQLALMGTDLSGNYVLTKDIDASATDGSNPSGIWSTSGWIPVGPNGSSPFTGKFDGKNHRISNLTIDRNTKDEVGLFGRVGLNGSVRDTHLTNANITGANRVGGLIGLLDHSTTSGSSVSGSISGTDWVGGLAGYTNSGTISKSSSSATVSGADRVGGLVGLSLSGTISASASSGTISGSENVGGLIGYQNGGSITTSKASGAVSGSLRVGGLVGTLSGSTIDQSFAEGSVTNSGLLTGGLVGVSISGTITRSYATGSVTGTDRVGGLVGISFSGNIDQSYATGFVTDTGIGTWNGGLIGYSHNDTLSNSFFDITTTGRANAIGLNNDNLSSITRLTGLTTTQFQDTAAFMALASNTATYNWDFNNIWAPPSSGYYPELYSVNPVIWANDVTTSSTYGQSTGTVTAVTSHGGPASYVFGPSPDAVTLTGGTVTVDPTTNAGTSNSTLVSQNVSQNSDQGQRYRIFYHGNATRNVAKANLTVTASNDSKTYGTLASLTGFTTSGLVNSDNVTGLSLTSTGSPVSATVGDYDIVANNATGMGLDNYNINYIDGTLTVAKAPLAIYASNDSKTYGTLANLTGYTSSGLVTANGDSITSVDLTSNGSPVSANVSTYYIDASNAQGNGLDNYDISYVQGFLAVNPADLTITANDASKTYGSVFTPTGYTVNGLVTANGDSITSLDLSTTGGAARADVGSYDILASNAQGTGLSFDGVSNYTITYVKGNLDVTKKPLTITGSNVSKTYGDTASGLGSLTYPGLVAGDSLSYTLSSNGQVNTANVGTYDIDALVSGTSGLGNNPLSHNYDITLQKGQLTVNPRAITVTARGGSSVYGDVPTNPGLSATNLASFDSVGALTGLSNSFGISGTTNAGTYTTQVAGTLSNSNYTVTQRVDGTWTVHRRPIYIFPDDQSRQYGAPNPTLTYQVSWQGLVNGDSLVGELATPANVTSPVGQYAITAGTLTNANNPNYDISVESFSSSEEPVFLRVTPAPLTITASDASKYLGQYFQPTGYTVAGLLNMDSVDALTLFSSGSPVSAPLGNYDIVPSAASGQGLSNYTITYVNGRLTVQDAPGEVEPPRITMTSILPLTACQDRFDKDGVVLDEDGTFARLQRFDCETDMAFDEMPKFN